MKKYLVLMILVSSLLGGCYQQTYDRSGNPMPRQQSMINVGTIAGGAGGATIGAFIGPKKQRTQNAFIGGIIGALVGNELNTQVNNAMESQQYERENPRPRRNSDTYYSKVRPDQDYYLYDAPKKSSYNKKRYDDDYDDY